MSSEKEQEAIIMPNDYATIGCVSKALLRFPPAVAQEIINMMAAGKGHRPIAEYIRSQGIKLQDRKVAMLLAEERAARAPIAKELAREAVAPELDEQLDSLSDVKRRLVNLLDLYDGNRKNISDHGMLLKIVDRIHKNIELYQKFAGIGEKDTSPEDGSRRLNDKLATLASKLAGVENKEDADIDVVEIDDDGKH